MCLDCLSYMKTVVYLLVLLLIQLKFNEKVIEIISNYGQCKNQYWDKIEVRQLFVFTYFQIIKNNISKAGQEALPIIMNVDTDNFHEIRKYITANDLIRRSQFIVYDLEFSGLEFDNNQKPRYDMFLNDRYQKMASVASKYNVVQVGLTFLVPKSEIPSEIIMKESDSSQQMAKKEKETEDQGKQKNTAKIQQNIQNTSQKSKYIAYPFNFFVFPRQSPSNNPTISMQATCVQFNSKNSMDWNRWIRKGITYVKISEINKIMQNFSNIMNTNSNVSITNTGSNNLLNTRLYGQLIGQLSENIKKIVEDIVKNCQGKPTGFKHSIQVPKFTVNVIKRTLQTYSSQYNINFMITRTTIHEQEDFEQQAVNIELKNIPIEHTHSDLVHLEIEIISNERRRQQQEKQKESILGFTLIFEEIWNSNKIFVGHNCLFDILFLYASFVDELPKDYQNFKKMICDAGMSEKLNGGKKFYDTKYVASQLQITSKIFKKGTSLEQLYKHYREKSLNDNILSLASGFESYDLDKPCLHEAGFDSYLTSWVFLHLPYLKENEGKLNIHKSYFILNIRTPTDQMRKDLKVFVIAIVLNNAYVAYEQLRTMRISAAKTVRDQLQKQKLQNQVIVIDGFKQIFISPKQISKSEIVINFLIRLKKEKIFNTNNIMSLESWIRMKAEASAVGKGGK